MPLDTTPTLPPSLVVLMDQLERELALSAYGPIAKQAHRQELAEALSVGEDAARAYLRLAIRLTREWTQAQRHWPRDTAVVARHHPAPPCRSMLSMPNHHDADVERCDLDDRNRWSC